MRKLWIPIMLILALCVACGDDGGGDDGDDYTDEPAKYECSFVDYCEARIDCGDANMTVDECTDALNECSGPLAYEMCLCACLILPLSCEILFGCHDHCHDVCCPG